jgi:5'-nucleotidase|tara:strand:- start:5482 stop:6252 length:771 start_codon:yes stop_codon:yes gene_type:complete
MLKILLSNDDGFEAPGLKVLYETLRNFAELFVVAPEINNSGAGCSITTNSPMDVTEHSNGFLSVTGKPADCVYLGLHELSPWKPDLVISGINLGANMGEDLLYSGTVGAALEATGLTYPSIAISAAAFHQPGSKKYMEPNYTTSAKVVLDLLQNYKLENIDPSIVLNINTPNVEFSNDLEYKITTIGSWGSRNPPQIIEDNFGKKTYWTSHRDSYPENDEKSDIHALEKNMVSISPINPSFSIQEVINQSFNLEKK